ncbi:glycosyltransferase family 39 protein [Pengzhenrongella frigida]|uniref:Glycosyltransferase RgtA/B/C/D-like domain-containing protein n=1 Tax=Pengzhenrongella frigida TaxID=1259133 RepID=A0A4Q5N042_9MICO|nr:glycosyltransferase family 39 protein [Cellulomonas sp. HLT2-17]RYV51375.1 hypothetical protein EUA98_08805 [Cellulomonas sp. HLT2-17]
MSSVVPQVAEVPDADLGTRTRRRIDPTTLRHWSAPAVLVLVAFILVGLHVTEYAKVGPVDELQHIDYLYKSPAIVAPGDSVGQDAMREEACRGIDSAGFVTPACSTTAVYNPRVFQELGYNTASINTPVYYTLTKVFALPLKLVTGIGSLVTTGRLVGGLWLAVGLLLAYASGRRLGIDRVPLAAVLIAFACAPSVLYPSATITPDAASFAVGAGIFLACLYWEGAPRRRWPVLALVVAVALLIKMTNVMLLLAVGLYFVIRIVRALVERRSSDLPRDASHDADDRAVAPWILGGIVVSVTTVVVLGATMAIQGALAHGNAVTPMSERFAVDAFPLRGMIEQIGVFLYPLGASGVSVGNGLLQMITERAIGTFFVAGLVGAALFWTPSIRTRSYAQALLLTAIIGGPIFVLVSFYGQGVYVPPPGRYAATLVPVVAVLTAGLLKTREATWLVSLGAAGMLLATLVRLLSV